MALHNSGCQIRLHSIEILWKNLTTNISLIFLYSGERTVVWVLYTSYPSSPLGNLGCIFLLKYILYPINRKQFISTKPLKAKLAIIRCEQFLNYMFIFLYSYLVVISVLSKLVNIATLMTIPQIRKTG